MAPKGNEQFYFNRQNKPSDFAGVTNESGILLEDDEFFHITCHVDPVLRAKIERGEFVELEKLLTKEKFKSRSDEGRLEFYNKDGHTYLAPVNRKGKITNIRRWEQAFRVYAAIYSKANPARAEEIWQYVYVINTAAASYTWENVSFYDYTFRQMMSMNPLRSWSKIFNHMWNLAMNDPIQKQNGQSNKYSYAGNSVSYNGRDNNGKRKRCSDACWKFNRNEHCNGSTCNFEHKCSYCGSYNHAVVDCPKLKGKMGNSGGKLHNNHANNNGHNNSSNKQNHNSNSASGRGSGDGSK